MSIRYYSGLSEFLTALYEGNSNSYTDEGSGIQFVTVLDNEFKIPIEFQSNLTHDLPNKPDIITIVALSDDGGYRVLARNLMKEKVEDLLSQYKDLPVDIRIRLIKDSELEAVIEDRIPLTMNRLSDYLGVKEYSRLKYNYLEPTPDDNLEYSQYKSGKLDSPKLLQEFDNTDDYEEFMEYSRMRRRSISKDKSIINRDESKVFDSSTSNSEDIDKVLEEVRDRTQDNLFRGFGLKSSDFDASIMTEGTLIGTLMVSSSYVHLFHLVSYHDIAAHVALEEYYKGIVDLVDELAENILESVDITEFVNVIYPGNDPIDYLEKIREYTDSSRVDLFSSENADSKVSLLDDISNLITGTLYKLKRLSSTKVFSSEFQVNKLELIKWKFNLSSSDLVNKLNVGISKELESKSDMFEVKNTVLNNLYDNINYYDNKL